MSVTSSTFHVIYSQDCRHQRPVPGAISVSGRENEDLDRAFIKTPDCRSHLLQRCGDGGVSQQIVRKEGHSLAWGRSRFAEAIYTDPEAPARTNESTSEAIESLAFCSTRCATCAISNSFFANSLICSLLKSVMYLRKFVS